MPNPNYLHYRLPVEMNYVGIPIVTGFSPIKTRMVTVSIEGGLVVNYQVSAQNADMGIGESPYLLRNDNIVSSFYGLELSTNILRDYSIFLSYRRITDMGPFLEDINPDDDNLYVHRGKTFSAGMRLRLTRESRRVKVLSDSDRVAPFAFGVKGGINLNNVIYQNLPNGYDSNADLQPGGHLGLFFQVKIFRNFSFMPELQYITKGYKYSDRNDNTGHLITHYFEQPFMFAYALSNRMSIEGGPTVGFFLWSNQNGARNDSKSEDFNVVEFGVNGGLRYSVSKRISLACRYYRGIRNNAGIYFLANGGFQSSTEERNENIQISTYFRLK